MNKKSLKILIGAFAVIFFLGIFVTYKITTNTKPIEYKVDCLASEIALRDITIFSSGNDAYLTGSYYFETLRSELNVGEIGVYICIDGKQIVNFMIGKQPFKVSTKTGIVGVSKIIKNLKITDESIMSIDMRYEVNGEQKEFHQDIELKNCKNKNQPLELR